MIRPREDLVLTFLFTGPEQMQDDLMRMTPDDRAYVLKQLDAFCDLELSMVDVVNVLLTEGVSFRTQDLPDLLSKAKGLQRLVDPEVAKYPPNPQGSYNTKGE